MTDAQQQALDRDGFVVLPHFCSPDLLRALQTRIEELFEQEGENAGSEFRNEANARRLANLVDKGDLFRQAIFREDLLELIAAVLGPRFKLSSLNARSTDPHTDDPQPLHVDMGLLPDERGNAVCNVVWMLDEFTPDNGATRVVPGSHRWGHRPQEAMTDPLQPHPEEILVTAPAGSVAVINAHTWHGGTANRTARPRLAMHSFFCRWDIPQQQYQKQLLRPETQAALTARERNLLALDDTYNDEISANPTQVSGFLK